VPLGQGEDDDHGTVATTLAAIAISQWYSPDIAKASTICFRPGAW
jgi:hypothetical protein